MKPTLVAAIALLAISSSAAFAWDGQDSNTGESVTIDSGNLVRPGNDIDIYDGASGEYHSFSVDDIQRYGGSVVVTGTDNETGESRELEMDGYSH